MHLPDPEIVRRLADTAGVQRVPSSKLDLFIARGAIDEETCAALVDLIERHRRPSTIADANGDPTFRTSETCDLAAAEPAVRAVESAIKALTGLDPAFGEPIQGQRYAPGQEFKDHTDYFEPGGADYARFCSTSGQRTWTVMVYLNRPEAGGATRFRRIDKLIQPEPGKLLAWNNRDRAGVPNPWTLHHGMKVRAGIKYIVTKWYRERPFRAG